MTIRKYVGNLLHWFPISKLLRPSSRKSDLFHYKCTPPDKAEYEARHVTNGPENEGSIGEVQNIEGIATDIDKDANIFKIGGRLEELYLEIRLYECNEQGAVMEDV